MTVMETKVAAVEIAIDGVRLTEEEMESLVELRVDQNLMLPDSFSLTLADPEFQFVDAAKFDIGKSVTLKFCSPDGRSLKQVFAGDITALEPEFTQNGISLTVRGYDKSHRLNRVRKTDTFQRMSADQIAKKIASANGLTPRAESTRVTKEFTQQSNETDWEFLWRLASMFDFEVVVEGNTLFFRKAGGPGTQTVALSWARSRPMLLSLRPRVTAVQQVKDVEVRCWDPKTKKEIVAKSAVTETDSKIGIQRSKVVNQFGGGTLVVADAPVTTIGEARALAGSFASQLANAWCEAEGSSEGDPRIVPGTKLKIEGVGRRFGGQYVVSKATHVFRGGSGYVSKFVVAGRSSRSLLDLVSGGSKSSWGDSIAIGVVTNTKDPDNLGRVRIKFPALNDGMEGWWARIASVGAGKDRGQLMLPLVNDEVLVAFEGGDAHKPYVLGTLWNNKDTPGELVHPDGSYHLKTNKQILMAAKEDVTIKTDKNLTVEIKGDASEKVDKGLKLKVGASEEVSVTQSFKLEAGTELLLKCGQASVKLSPAGIEIKGAMVQLQGTGPVTIKGATVAIN
jgi:phage protein D